MTLLKYARIERERRYLLRDVPDGVGGFRHIVDLYVPGTRLRLRRIESDDGSTLALKLTQKYPSADGGATHAVITNLYLDEAEFEALSCLGGARLQKRRYALAQGGWQFGIDVFEGDLDGLVLAECEFGSDDDVERIVMPSFVVEDVTDDSFFTGAALAFADPTAVRKEVVRRLAV